MAEISREVNAEMEEKIEELSGQYAQKISRIISDMDFYDELELLNAYRERKGEAEIKELTRANFNEEMRGCSPWEVLEALNGADFDPDDEYFANSDFGGLCTCNDIWFEDEPEDVVDALMSGELESTDYDIRAALSEYSEKELEIRDSYNSKACERELVDKFKELLTIYKRYRPDFTYLSLCAVKKPDENTVKISIVNRYWEGGEDENFPIQYNSNKENK